MLDNAPYHRAGKILSLFEEKRVPVLFTGPHSYDASPVELYDRTTIEAIGAVNVADITANMAVNSGSENNADSFTKFARSAPEKPGVPLAMVLKFTSGAIEIFFE